LKRQETIVEELVKFVESLPCGYQWETLFAPEEFDKTFRFLIHAITKEFLN